MTDFVEEETNFNSKLAQEVQQELPTIYVSVKNLIACTMGQNFDAPLEPKIQPQNVMTCAKYLLQAIRSEPLPDVEQFCAEHPQPEDQLGVDRLEDICKYKVIYALRYKAEEKGGRITRLFGKSYIRWSKMWSRFRSNTEELLRENTHIPLEEIEYFLQTYEASLKLDDSEQRERTSSDTTAELIWATDFNTVLSSMQKERIQRVENRQYASSEEVSSMEDHLFGGGSTSSTSRPSSQTIPSNELQAIRSRATTMEQLGLVPQSADGIGMIRAQNYEVSSPPHPVQQQQNFPLQAFAQQGQGSPPDRSRATTLDLFAFEQQSFINLQNYGR